MSYRSVDRERRGRNLWPFWKGLLLWLLLTPLAPAQVPQVLDMRYPGPGVTGIRVPSYDGVNVVSFLGDINGDRYEDFITGIPSTVRDDSFDSLLVYGQPVARLGESIEVETLHSTRFLGTKDIFALRDAYAGLGDLDGDGHGDFVLASPATSWEGVPNSGLVLLIFGGSTYPAEVTLADLKGAGLRSLRFVSRDESRYAGKLVRNVGDLNGDGKADLAISADAKGTENGGPTAGRLYVIFGGFPLSGDIELSEVGHGIPGFVVHGAYGSGPDHLWDGLGCCDGMMAAVGDANGDGYDDFAVSALGAADGRSAIYLVYGGRDLPSELFTARPGGPLVEIQAVSFGSQLGSPLAAAGDVDGDGFADILAGLSGPGQGKVYFIYGGKGWPATIRLDDARLRTFRLEGTPPAFVYPSFNGVGGAVAGVGDWNGDGVPDLLLTASGQSVRFGTLSGKSYLLFGGPHLVGRALDQAVGTPSLPGLTILGAGPLLSLGAAVAAGGDFDGDGLKDFLLANGPRDVNGSTLPLEERTIYVFWGGRGAGSDLAVSAVDPPEGSLAGGSEVTVLGRGFQGDETVSFGGAPSQSARVISSAEIKVALPAQSAPGSVDVEVRGRAGSARLEQGVTYTEPPGFQDLLLDPAILHSQGYRVLVYRDTLHPPPGLGVSQFMTAFFADLDGDHLDDLVLGAPVGTPEGNSRVSIIFGRRRPFPEEIALGETRLYGTVIDGSADVPYNLASYIAFPGDLNGDGYPELALGPYLLLGRAQWPSSLLVSDEIQAGTALQLPLEACGSAVVAAPGDYDGNGQPDVLLSYDQCTGAGGRVRLFLQGISSGGDFPATSVITGDPAPVDLPQLTLHYPRSFGSGLSAGGDLNGDRLPDFIVGAGAEHHAGIFYLILSGAPSFRETSVTEFQDLGFAVAVHHNETLLGFMGRYAAAAGDFNGDGLADAVLGAPGGGRDFEGVSYVIYGSKELGKSIREIGVITASRERELAIVGESSYDWSGYPVSLGDVNGDGFPDIGITGDDLRNTLARAYVVFGGRDLPTRLELSRLGPRGFRILGSKGNRFSARSGGIAAGDLDGDGLRDIAVGEAASDGTSMVRRVVVVFGGRKVNTQFVRGDANADGQIGLSDAVFILSFLFVNGSAPKCSDAADVDDNGIIQITDAIYLLSHLFLGAKAPTAPYPSPGSDPTGDSLNCTQFR
jgi:hypothetical protein